MKRIRNLMCAMAFVLATVGLSATGWSASIIIVAFAEEPDRYAAVCVEQALYEATEQLSAVNERLGGGPVFFKAYVDEPMTCADIGF